MAARAVAHAGHLHGDGVALLGRQGQVLALHERFPLTSGIPLVRGVVHMQRVDKTLVGQDGIIDETLAHAQLLQVEPVGFCHLDDRCRHIGLVLHRGLDVVLVLHLSFFHFPADADSLVAQADHLIGSRSRVNQEVVLVRVVLVGGDVHLVVALGQHDGVKSVLVALALCYQCTGDRIAQHNLGILHVGLLLGVVGVFVGDVDDQRTSLVRHRRDIEVDESTVAVLAVDAKHTRDGHVELHVVGRHHAQHHGGRVVGVQTGHLGAGERCHPRGQRQGDLARVALTVVRQIKAIVAPAVLVHGGNEVLLLHH